MINSNPTDILFLDYTLPEMNGISVLKKIRVMYPEMKIIMISGNKNQNVIKEAKLYGIDEFLFKPFLQIDVNKVFKKWNNKKSQQL